MDKLIINPTDLAQWHALVGEAQAHCACALEEDLESYLVFLLMRFATDLAMTESVLGMDFLKGTQEIGNLRHTLLRDVGDKCLLFSGLFPGNIERRRLTLSYFINLGQSAYGTLSLHEPSKTQLYEDLAGEFVSLMDILQATRTVSQPTQSVDLVNAFELWQETRSQQALETLREHGISESLINSLPQARKH